MSETCDQCSHEGCYVTQIIQAETVEATFGRKVECEDCRRPFTVRRHSIDWRFHPDFPKVPYGTE